MNKKTFIHDLKKLIGFPTLTGQPEGFQEAMAFIVKQINPKAHITLLPNDNEPILLACNKPTNSPDICYLVHVDVVAAQPDQFTMQIRDGIAYGRGVSDMKYSIPVGYALLNELIKNKSDLSFMLAITSDEERGGFKGAGYLADEYKLTPKLLIVPDGGDNFVIINKSKGVCHLKISKLGKPAHSSRPWLGENALISIINLASELIRQYENANKNEGWHTTMNIGKLDGGISINQVPSQAELYLDFRFPPESDSATSIIDKVTSCAQKIDSSLVVESIATGIAPYTDLSHPALQVFIQTLSQKLGRDIKTEGGYGSHDGRHFNKYGVPFIMTKPEGGDIHGDNEHINIDSVILLYEALLQFLKNYSQILKQNTKQSQSKDS